MQGAVHGARLGEDAVDALRDGAMLLGRPQVEPHVDAPDDEHAAVELDLPLRLAREPVA